MSNLTLQAVYFFMNEDSEAINIKFYQDTDTLQLTMWAYDPVLEESRQIPYLPNDIKDGIEYYENKHHVNLTRVSAEPSAETGSQVEQDKYIEPVESGRPMAAFEASHAQNVLDAAMLSDIIVDSLEGSIYTDDISLIFNDDGNLEVHFRSSIAVIAIGILSQ